MPHPKVSTIKAIGLEEISGKFDVSIQCFTRKKTCSSV